MGCLGFGARADEIRAIKNDMRKRMDNKMDTGVSGGLHELNAGA